LSKRQQKEREVIMKLGNQKGFTLVEIIIVVVLILFLAVPALIGGVYYTVLAGNFWVTPSGALQCAERENPAIVSVDYIDRNVYAPTKVEALDADGTKYVFDLDANILFDKTCTPAEE